MNVRLLKPTLHYCSNFSFFLAWGGIIKLNAIGKCLLSPCYGIVFVLTSDMFGRGDLRADLQGRLFDLSWQVKHRSNYEQRLMCPHYVCMGTAIQRAKHTLYTGWLCLIKEQEKLIHWSIGLESNATLSRNNILLSLCYCVTLWNPN